MLKNLTQYSYQQDQLHVNNSMKKIWLDEELQEDNSRINIVPLSRKVCIVSSEMMGYDITFIPKPL